eukprot:scaffold193_cov255-Pinguiococcus_pyrenoidosus.AAC.27
MTWSGVSERLATCEESLLPRSTRPAARPPDSADTPKSVSSSLSRCCRRRPSAAAAAARRSSHQQGRAMGEAAAR